MAEYMASMVPLPLTPGMVIRFEAVSPTDGSQVTGVTVEEAVIYVDDVRADEGTPLEIGPYVLVPGTPAAGSSLLPATVTGGL